MKIPKKRSILFFPGIFIEKTKVKEVIENHEMDISKLTLQETNTSDRMYNLIPSIFKSKDTWMQNTNLLCNMCSKPITDQPIPLPSYITYDENDDSCVYKGISSIHHSWTCASMYNTVFNDNNPTSYFSLKHLYKYWNDIDFLSDIPIGIRYTEMQQYGGKLTEQQWDTFNNNILRDSINKSRNLFNKK